MIMSIEAVDKLPTRVRDYGKCTHAVERSIRNSSHWCKFNRMGSWPEWPNAQARKKMKFGRQTVYRGSILAQRTACNKVMMGDSRYASVAVSTKYLKTYQGGWAQDKGACGQCMCIMILGADNLYNKGLHKEVVRKYVGYSFMGKVMDRFGEGPDDSIDILQDRPYSFAPNTLGDNPRAYIVNKKDGYRIFTETHGAENPESVGTWTVLWNFVSCKMSHRQCAAMMRKMGYNHTRTPKWLKGRKY